MTISDQDPPQREPDRGGKPERFHATDFETSRALRDGLLGLGNAEPLPPDPPTIKQKQEAARQLGDGEFALSLVEDDVTPFQSSGEAYAVLCDKKGSHVIALRSREFGALIRRRYRSETGCLLGKAAFGAALQALIDKALDAPDRTLHLRTAPTSDGICLDLGGSERRAVMITSDGYKLTDSPPAMFRASSGRLVEPAGSGDFALLRRHLNVRDAEFQLMVAWLTFAMCPTGPYPLLVLSGEQGAAKTTASGVLRRLLDGNAFGGRPLPASKRDLDAAARHAHLLSFDNVSYIAPTMSDSLARLATGEEDGRRQLFTDGDEVVFQATRPILVNGIANVITRPDLVDRSIFIQLPFIPRSQRLPREAFWQRFEQDAPAIMAGLLDLVACGLKLLPETVVNDLPRMADFAIWGSAIERAHWPEGSFMASYEANIASGNTDLLQVNDVAMAVVELMSQRTCWTGTATQLLELLESGRTSLQRRLRPLSPNAQRLSIELDRLTPVFRRRGIDVQGHQAPNRHRTRLITMSVGDDAIGHE
ncbi:MAG: hypothetical protein DI537_02400 [Stutzerimonas stutzeri]|nr:MAG: hypothetical protein DI537_02400 [Stutzerimonas stutzeri]